ncbi:MAG: hypothetical protein WCT17_04480 [Bacilli bacterium]
MTNDYNSWFLQNEDLLKHLYHHESLLFDRMSDVVLVMNHVQHIPESEKNADIEVIFDVGFSYLFHRIEEIKIYLDKYFEGDLHRMLHVDTLINYALYLEDLKDTLVEQEAWNDNIKYGFDQIENQIEAFLNEDQEVSDSVIDDFNVILMSIIPGQHEYLTIPEVFSRIVEELNIENEAFMDS